MEQSYEISSTAIIHEILDKEAIIANLDNGIYYSLRGTAVPVWQLLLSKHNLPEIIPLFAAHYSLPAEQLKPHLTGFLSQLLQENLLKETQSSAEPCSESLVWPENFTPPVLEKFEEMSQLLMLDPIHEVDEQGWPNRAISSDKDEVL